MFVSLFLYYFWSMKQRIRIAIFASGSGSNAENFMEFFSNSEIACISLILSNKKDAYVLQRAKRFEVPSVVIPTRVFQEDGGELVQILENYKIDFIVLAGFLLKIPAILLQKYHERILNIHPALLPKYGGKGMYGENVHKAVIAAAERESGITIHLVDEIYDHGEILYQSKCEIVEGETPQTLAEKIHLLEKIYPAITEQFILDIKQYTI